MTNFLVNNGVNRLVKFLTRDDSVINLLIINDKHSIFGVEPCPNPPFCISDHSTVALHVRIPNDLANKKPAYTGYSFMQANYAALEQYLHSIHGPTIFLLISSCDIENLWQTFKSIVWNAIDLYVRKIFVRN